MDVADLKKRCPGKHAHSKFRLITNSAHSELMLIAKGYSFPYERKMMKIVLDKTKFDYIELFFTGPGDSQKPCEL